MMLFDGQLNIMSRKKFRTLYKILYRFKSFNTIYPLLINMRAVKIMISVHYKLKIIEYKGKEHYTIGIFSETSDNIVGQICKLYSFVYRCLLAKKML